MPATIIAIADAVVVVLNAATLSQSFAAERAYVPVHDLTDLDTVRVTVVPRELSLAMISRRDDDFTYVIDVALQVRAVPAGVATAAVTNGLVDPYMLLAEEIVDLFRGKVLAGRASASCVAAANAPIYLPDHLDEKRVFTSVLSLTFREARAR